MYDNVFEDTGIYKVPSVIKEDIINSLEFNNKEDRILCSSIIDNIEKSISNTIKNNKCASIPYIGCLRRKFNSGVLVKEKFKLSNVRKVLNKEDYKEYCRTVFNEYKHEANLKTIETKRVKRIRKIFKKQYETYLRTINKSYADMFLFSVSNFTQVEFNEEIEEQYSRLRENE